MAVSAYTDEGLLKKHALLGTSLAADPTRAEDKRKFGELYERAKSHGGDRESFQTLIASENEAQRKTALESLAKMEDTAATQSGEVQKYTDEEFGQTERFNKIEDTLSRFTERGVRLRQNVRPWLGRNQDIAREARAAYWDRSVLGKGDRETYEKGFRPDKISHRLNELERNYYDTLESLGDGEDILGADKIAEIKALMGRGPSRSSSEEYGDRGEKGDWVYNWGRWFGSGAQKKHKKRAKAAGRVMSLIDKYKMEQLELATDQLSTVYQKELAKAKLSETQAAMKEQRNTLEKRAKFLTSFFA